MADSTPSAPADQCHTCHKTGTKDAPLKRCALCKLTSYCNRECQKADWKDHKKICPGNARARGETVAPSSSNPASGTNALEAHIEKPFHQLHAKKWLHGRPPNDVYKLLIDTWRLRLEDNYKLTGNFDFDGIHCPDDDAKSCLRLFIEQVETHSELLPEWWSLTSANACIQSACKAREWSWHGLAVFEQDMIEHYGEPLIPMQLRIFGAQVFGTGAGGQRVQGGASVLEMQMQIENGSFPSM